MRVDLTVYLVALLFLISSCGSSIVINSKNYRGDIEFGKGGESLLPEHASQDQVGNLLGKAGTQESEVWSHIDKHPNINKFSITTYYELEDFFLSFIPFYSSRTIIYKGKIK